MSENRQRKKSQFWRRYVRASVPMAWHVSCRYRSASGLGYAFNLLLGGPGSGIVAMISDTPGKDVHWRNPIRAHSEASMLYDDGRRAHRVWIHAGGHYTLIYYGDQDPVSKVFS